MTERRTIVPAGTYADDPADMDEAVRGHGGRIAPLLVDAAKGSGNDRPALGHDFSRLVFAGSLARACAGCEAMMNCPRP